MKFIVQFLLALLSLIVVPAAIVLLMILIGLLLVMIWLLPLVVNWLVTTLEFLLLINQNLNEQLVAMRHWIGGRLHRGVDNMHSAKQPLSSVAIVHGEPSGYVSRGALRRRQRQRKPLETQR